MSEQINVVSGCRDTPDDKTFMFPKGAKPEGVSGKRHVLVRAGDRKKLLKISERSDGGEGACVSASTRSSFGADDVVSVTYDGIGFWGRLRHDSGLRLQALIAILTLVAAGLSAYGTWFKNTTSTSATTWDRQTATLVLATAAVLALLKFWKELKDL